MVRVDIWRKWEDEDIILNDIATALDFLDSARKIRISDKFTEFLGMASGNKYETHVSILSATDVKLPK